MISIPELYELFIACEQKITTDTRKLEKGAIFFALKGDNFDANTFAKNAVEQGCAYAIVDNEDLANGTTILLVANVLETLQQLAKFHRGKLNIPFIGITGSNGKTTNKELIHAVLSRKYNTYATKGNLNNHIGVPLTILSITSKHEMAIIEMGANHQGEIAFLADIANPEFGIITNIGRAHLEGFGGIEGVKKGKSELYKHISKHNGKLFVNADDEVLMELAKGIEQVTYGENISYDFHGKRYENSEYVEFSWNTKGNDLIKQPIVKTQMFGHYNYINLLCAACVGNYFKVSEKEINLALAEYVPEMNRSQVKKTEHNTLILDAYNANPSSMSIAIENFAKQNFPSKLLVLGDMLELGEYSEMEHEKIIRQTEALKLNAFFVGALFYELKDKFNDFSFYKTSDDLAKFFENDKPKQKTLLIKGSRGVRLEKIVEFL
jgi:UDP-N-acetylmuramoyl-tripeptide--D-alanyl-D-alanine ligase